MFQIDEYESRFKRAAKERYHYAPVPIDRVLLLTDLTDAAEIAQMERKTRRLLRVIEERGAAAATWDHVGGDAYGSTQELLALVQAKQPDLVVTYRSLKESDRNPVYSLGTYMDVITQATSVPTLVLPHDADDDAQQVEEGTPQVMVVTDHLTGDDRLVNWGLRFVLGDQGDLLLTHVEDDHTFARYMDVISKIDAIDTATAEREIRAQLLKEPTEFMDSCREVLEAQGIPVRVHSIVRLGHRVREYRALVDEHEVDLLVFNAKDEGQTAMHGIAYSLAVELKRLPLLLL